MNILYISSLCSNREYERMFRKFGTSASHASQKFHRLMLEGFVRNNCQVDALCQRVIPAGEQDDKYRPNEVEDQVRYTYIPHYSNRKLNRLMVIWHTLRGICKWHKDNPDGVVMCDIVFGELSFGVWLATRFRSIKTTAVVTDVPMFRAYDIKKGIKTWLATLKQSLISNYGSYVFLTEQMNKTLNRANRPYALVEGFADLRAADEPNLLENKYPEKVCMMAGLLIPACGIDLLLEAFQKVKDPHARLVVYGSGTSTDNVKNASEIDPRICYLGELTNGEIMREEKKVTLLINPRPPEGEFIAYSFPSKNMEYIASGTPMLAYNLPCVPPEYLPHFYRADENVSSDTLAASLDQVLAKSREELHAMGLKSQQWILEHKSAGQQAKKVIDMLQTL